MNRQFVANVVLTILDAVVFLLCVDRGLQPVAVVGACYVALRLFSKDASTAVNLLEPVGDTVVEFGRSMVEKFKESRKETPAEELSKI